jgi:hypothetical protein
MSILHVPCSIGGVLFPCCMPMSLLHVMSWRMSMSMLYRFEQAAWTRTCSMDIDMQLGHGHEAWTSMHHRQVFTCCLSLFMSMLHVYVHITYPCPCCMFISMLNAHVHAACPSSSFVSMPMLDVCVYAACLCPYCMNMNIHHGHGLEAWTFDLQHGRGQQHGPGHAP